MGAISFNQPTGNESPAELADMIASLQKIVEHLSRNINSNNITEIGGWLVDMDRLTSIDGDVGMSSAYAGADDVRLWAGDAVPEMAPWRVYNSGKGVATGWRVQSKDGAYPYVTMDPETELFGAYASPDEYLQIGAKWDIPGHPESPFLEFASGDAWANMYLGSTSMNITSNVEIDIISSADIYLSNLLVNGWEDIATVMGPLSEELSWLQYQIDAIQDGKSAIGHTHTVTVGGTTYTTSP